MNDKLKIVVLSAFYEPMMVGGAEKMVKEVVERLGKKHNITMVTGLFDRSVPRKEERPAFKIIRVGIGHKQIDKVLYPILAALKVRTLKPQIAHAIMESYAGAALALVKYLAPQVKRILTLQSGDLDDDSKQAKWYIRVPWKIIHTSPHIITAISSFLAKRSERLGVPKDRIRITPNGVDLSHCPQDSEKIENRVIIVSRLSWEKAHKYVLQAWPKVIKAVPGAKLVIVGDGDERENIKKLINELNIRSSVEMAGELPNIEAIKEIAKSEVFICPSLAEGLGVVFIEAQACGTPSIGTRVGGIPDVIVDNENGLLIEPKNSEQIAEAIIKLLTNIELRETLAKRGLETCRKFEWSTIMDKIEKIYFDILK